jgi:hypothetical protein
LQNDIRQPKNQFLREQVISHPSQYFHIHWHTVDPAPFVFSSPHPHCGLFFDFELGKGINQRGGIRKAGYSQHITQAPNDPAHSQLAKLHQ